MKKTKFITKYITDWQIVRVKNHKLNYEDKVKNVLTYYNNNKNYNNWERVYNYLEGLYISCRNIVNSNIVQFAMDYMNQNKSDDIIYDEKDTELNKFKIEDIILLYKDLYKRNNKWLGSNYKNKELNDYLKKLYNYIGNNKLQKNFDTKIIKKSTYKFLY